MNLNDAVGLFVSVGGGVAASVLPEAVNTIVRIMSVVFDIESS